MAPRCFKLIDKITVGDSYLPKSGFRKMLITKCNFNQIFFYFKKMLKENVYAKHCKGKNG